MITIRRISADNPFYEQEIALREQALLRPIGLDFDAWRTQFPGFEDRMEHFVAILDHPTGPRVVGCAGLVVEDGQGGRGRVVQMAVDPQRQGEGIGRRLLAAVEARAMGELGLSSLYCHAQNSAVGFYERQGWKGGEEFEEAGIPHRVMTMAGTGPDPQAPSPEEFAPQ